MLAEYLNIYLVLIWLWAEFSLSEVVFILEILI